MAEHKINCPGCDQHLSVPEELAGQQIDCPSCSKPMTVPAFAEVEEDDEEWVEESTPKSSKLIVGIAAGIAVLGVVAFLTISGNPEELADANPVKPPVENPTTEKLSSTPKQQAKTVTDIDNKLFDVISKSALISRGNTTGETVLKEAKTLLDKGANVNAVGNFRKASPLYMAAYHDSKEMTELLLNNGADVHQTDYSGETPLHTAAYHGRGKTDVVVLLVKNGADVNAKESLYGKTALHWAVSQEQTNIARFLIESGADVNAEITSGLEKGKTALDMVSILGNMNGMRELLTSNGAKKGKNRRVPADPLGGMMPGLMNPYGLNPLGTMGAGGNTNGMGMMGGFPGMGMMGSQDDPFGMGMYRLGQPPEYAEIFKDDIEEINQRLAKGEPLNQYGESGYTELMVATLASDLDLAKRLLEKKANPNLKEKPIEDEEMLEGISTGRTALHMAAETQSKAMCELLYNNGALLNVKDSMGFTPLDSILFQFDPQMDPMNPFSQKKVKPKMTKEGRETIVYLRSKKAKSMTAKQREEIMAKNNPFQQMMMPLPGMMPGMMPGYGHDQSDPFGVGIDPNNPFGAGYGMPPRSESKKRERK